MPGYFVPKKNRCLGGECMSMPPSSLLFATSSSIHSSIKSSRTVSTTYEENKNVSSSIIGKGEGNTRKQGSGGNSYAAYLARKKGTSYCNCNVKK